ncbi:type II/IV secretion system protein [Rhizobium sp. S9]|uniref:GspE/PulE family protein n=2 Tax=unclassified Rhizobium TaxID=2613769 RepID=UPI000A20FB5D|nr:MULTISPECIES: GspE/PulE family protein [unclassified Rhizobium]ARO26434.1 type II secretion system protein E [Rhizobium sp. TAL182]PDS96536.1 type II/IV secretion system protein [Rhizobium sp. S9]
MIDATELADRFLSHLAANGTTTSEAVQRIRSARRQTGQPLDMVIRELGVLPELTIASEMARFLDLDVIQDCGVSDGIEWLEKLGWDYAAEKAIFPMGSKDSNLHLAIADPFDHETIEAVSYFFDLPIQIGLSPRSVIEEQITRFRRASASPVDEAILEESASDVDLERLLDVARDAPVVKFVSKIVQRAIDDKATDIHLEPQADIMRVRLRRDGLLLETETAPRSLHTGVISRLKILARLNIAERRLPQDGRLRLPVRGQEVDFRLSVVPSVHGETAALRILDRESIRLDLQSLGYDAASARRIDTLTRRPNGLILVTGPTGSGKTTTLYSILAGLNRPSVKIFTVEDPVEYRIAGITQLQIDPAIGLSFATALRSVLRQDPDIVLVGEIRDRETAEIAIQAALTGRLVLSTLHTNSAIGAFNRLRDMGVEPFLLAATIRGVIGQRLLRQCCGACRDLPTKVGCTVCEGTEFKGRTATYEILEVSERFREAMRSSNTEEDLEAVAIAHGLLPLREHGRTLVAKGVTTMDEVLRVIDAD